VRVAYVCEGVPYPPAIGAQQRRFHLLRAYAEAGFGVTLFALARSAEEEAAADGLRGYCEDVVLVPFGSTRGARAARRSRWRQRLLAFGSNRPWTVERYRSSAMEGALAGRRGEVEVVHVSRLTSVPHLARRDEWRAAGVTLVLDLDDIESEVKRRALEAGLVAGRKARLLTRMEQVRLKVFESRVLRDFDLVLVCSEVDRRRLGPANSVVVPNGIELPEGVGAGGGDGRTLLFVGFMDYAPNADAVQCFVRQILPAVRREVPQARLVVVGRASDSAVRRLDDGAGVNVVGEVGDLSPYYRAASVVVVPLRAGGGTRIKILEAFAWRRPVVSTTVGAEGIPAEPGKDIFVEDEPEAFAARCVELLRNPRVGEAMAGRARHLAEEYQWARLRPRLVEAVLRRRGESMGAGPLGRRAGAGS
jgi:glycosyltransferase involved in cell wall biosynthesis